MFSITQNKGFHIKFENGWTISVQFGQYNYSSNYDLQHHTRGDAVPPSNTAEIAAFNNDGDWFEWPDGNTVQGYQTPKQVLEAMNLVAAL